MAFIHGFIDELRATDWKTSPDFDGWARELADHLEFRLKTPLRDGFDLPVTADAERDRMAMAAWLDAAAQAPPFLAPSWGRTFSGAVAWLLRNNHELGFENVMVACSAAIDPSTEELVRAKGLQAAYEDVTRTPAQRSRSRRQSDDWRRWW
jgi:hypothetical protein